MSSLNITRVKIVSKLIVILSEYISLAGKRPKTVRSITRNFIRFIDWCDNNNYQNVLNNISLAKIAFIQYVGNLREKFRRGGLKSSSAQLYQSGALVILNELYNSNFNEGVNLIHSVNDDEPTVVPDEDSVGKALALCTVFFEGLADLVINCKPYPFMLIIPKFLDWDDNHLWIFPTNRWYMTPEELINRINLNNTSWAYDYKNGRIATYDEIATKYTEKYVAKDTIKQAFKIINRANKDPKDLSRIKRAVFACNSFLTLFIANTGMNLAQVLELHWCDDYKVGMEHQGFRQIKYRANNKYVSFEIQKKFLPHFKLYIELRKYLLADRDCSLLFFCFGQNCVEDPIPLKETSLNLFHRSLKKIYPEIPRITTREYRVFKADHLINHTDPSTAGLLLGNSTDTILEAYANGSESNAIVEMSDFLEKISESVRRVVVQASERSSNAIDTELGECIQFNHPASISSRIPVQPDCKQPEGCLFCDKYLVHADERDTRKLISCKYVINQTRPLAKQEMFESQFSMILNRIDLIIEQIIEVNGESEMVTRIIAEVEDNEKLDIYWEAKLRMLIEAGIVS